MGVWKGGIWRRVVLASMLLLALTAAALSVVLEAEASSRADGRELAQRLVPAAAASVELLQLYQAQQNWLRDYVTAGHAGPILDSHGALLPGYDILEKPFTEAALLSRVRKALTRGGAI